MLKNVDMNGTSKDIINQTEEIMGSFFPYLEHIRYCQ
ncbi:hypothetical protein [Galbibacter sp. BG1]